MQQDDTSQKIWTKSFTSLALTQFILFTVFYSLLTTLPIYVIEDLNGSESKAGLVVTLMLASAILIRPFTAKILDLLTKKRTLIISVLAFMITTFIYLFIETFTALLVLRFIHGISFALVTTATSAIAADIIPKARRGAGLGYFAMAMNLAVVAGPFIGLSLLQFISFKQFFAILSILMVVSLLFSFMVTVHEHAHARTSLSLKLTDLVEIKALPIAGISGIVGVAYASILSFVPVFAEENGLETTANYFFLVFAIVMIASRPTLGRLFDERGAKTVLVPSLVVFAIGLFVLSVTSGSVLLLIAGGVIGLGYGSLLPGFQALSVQSTSMDRSGHAMSTFFIFYDLGIAFGAFIWGLVIAGSGFHAMYISGAVLMLITTIILYVYLTKKQKNDEAGTN